MRIVGENGLESIRLMVPRYRMSNSTFAKRIVAGRTAVMPLVDTVVCYRAFAWDVLVAGIRRC
jgi:hypothetical protein